MDAKKLLAIATLVVLASACTAMRDSSRYWSDTIAGRRDAVAWVGQDRSVADRSWAALATANAGAAYARNRGVRSPSPGRRR